MNQESTVDEMARAIAQYLRTEANFSDPSLIGETTKLFELGVVDSLMIVSLIGYCEQTFGCQISPDELTEENLESPLALARLLNRDHKG